MLLSLTSTAEPATDLGFLLHKHPDRVRSVEVAFGVAHVFYPEATPQRCTATLFVDVDPIALSRRSHGAEQSLEPYVNDRAYAASSMLSVAIGRLFGSALNGTCESHPTLVEQDLPLEIAIPVLPARGGEAVVGRLFEPLGYSIEVEPIVLDDEFPKWGDSRYVSLRMSTVARVQDVLSHLYVLLPVLDERKHYWIGDDEVDKLLRRGGDWLPAHPEHEFIARRYLRFPHLTREALARISEDGPDPDEAIEAADEAEAEVERPISLNRQRLDAVTAAVLTAGGGRVVDLGCGEGRLVRRLLDEPDISHVCGVDVSLASLARAERRLRVDEMSDRRRERVSLLQGALTYRDERIQGFDAATVVEVIEHLDVERLDVFTTVLFEHTRAPTVIVTTPNREYNVHFENVGRDGLRHRDHRFEWTRAEFADWANAAAAAHAYTLVISAIGPDDPGTGAPTQMAVFRR